MLALERPLGVVAGLALFGDHADGKRVFYIPTRPQLAKAGNAPEISFVKFRDADASSEGVGLLSFTTELVASEEQLEKATSHLTRQGMPEPWLVQVPWIGGKAVFAAALQQGDGFVETMLGEVTPDLAATNRAMFSLRLSEEGARLIDALLRMDGPSPLGVRYELEYAGLRPALDARIRADYSRIYKELSWGFQVGVAYEGVGVRASVESATQKLIESGAIQIEVLHFTDDAALQARVDDAIRWIEDRILQDFFKTSLQPAAHEDLLKRAIELATALGAATLQDALKDSTLAGKLAQQLGVSPDALQRLGGAGGGMGGGAGAAGGESEFSLQLQFSFRDIHQEELKTITLDWREARAEKRIAAPQGLLSSFGVTPHVIEAADIGTFWDRLNVTVRALGDLAEAGAQLMVVQLAYPDENAPATQNACSFQPGQVQPKQFSAWTNGKPPRYRVRTEVHFDQHGPWPGPAAFTGRWQTSQSLDLAVHPLSEVPKIEFEISPGQISFAETPQAQVDVRIGSDIVSSHMIGEKDRTSAFRRRLDDGGDPPHVEARVTWFLAEGDRIEGDWTVVEGTVFLVHRPWRSARTLRVLPLLPPDYLDALVTLTLHEGSRSHVEELRFEPGDRRAKQVTIPTLSEHAPPVRVDTLVIRGDGSTFAGQPFDTSDPVVIVRDRDGELRQIAVRLVAGPTLAGHGLMAVQVQLIGEDGAALDSVVFTESQRTPGMLLVPVAPAGSPAPRYRVTRYGLNGVAAESEPQAITGPEVLVTAGAVVHT
jgi:hypothetical protein